jgi:DnaD/phage-associated family protein
MREDFLTSPVVRFVVVKEAFTLMNQPFEVRRARQGFFWDDNAIFDMGLSSAALLVRLYLCRCADNHTAQAHPSLTTIAEKVGLARSTVQKAIAELIDRGLLVKENRQKEGSAEQLSCLYTLLPARAPEETKREGIPSGGTPAKGGIPSGGTGVYRHTVHPIPPGGKKQYSLNNSNDHGGGPAFGPDDPACVCARAWTEMTAQMVGSPAVEMLASFLEDGIEVELLLVIMREAVARGKHRLDYVYGIAKRCIASGILTVEQFQDDLARFAQERQQTNVRRQKARKREASKGYSQEDYDRAFDRLMESVGYVSQ